MASSINALTNSGGGVVTTADASGILNLQSNGTTVAAVSSTGVAVTGDISSTGAITATGQIAALRSPASQSMVGTDIALFTGIPSWAKRITVANFGASGSPSIRLGTSGGIVSTGYTSVYYSTLTNNNTGGGSLTTAFTTQSNDGTFILYNVGNNTWLYASNHCNSGNRNTVGTGYLTLGSALTQIQLIGTFTTGTINIFYE
jgi:hypothetical protein